MKKAPSYLAVALIIGVLLAGNLLALFLFREQAKFTAPSLIPTVTAALVTVSGLLAIPLRHKENFLVFRYRRSKLFWIFFSAFAEDDPRTYTEEYERTFRRMLLVFFLPVPFYIPVIFFASGVPQMLLTLALLFAPQFVFIAWGIRDTLQDVKEAKEEDARLEAERREQERREELGHWK